jgi:hypothetical protein
MLRYKITPYERAFTFQILDQDRVVSSAIDSVGGTFYSSNGWKIMVKNSPEVKVVSKRVYLRGKNKAYDMRIDRTWNFRSNYERDRSISSLENALAELISFAREYDNNRYFIKDDIWEERAVWADDYGIWYYNTDPVSIVPCHPKSVRIDANGWGNNKLEDKNLVYVSC